MTIPLKIRTVGYMTGLKKILKGAKTGQSNRFVEAARELGADVQESEFDRALFKVASAPPAPMHKPPKQKARKRSTKKA
jgi:hypothetical protein